MGEILLTLKIITTITGFLFAGIYIWRYSRERSQRVLEIIIYFFSYGVSTLISTINQGYIFPNKGNFEQYTYTFYRTFLAFLSFVIVVYGNIGLLQFYLETKFHRNHTQKKIVAWYLIYTGILSILGTLVIWYTRVSREESGDIYPLYGLLFLLALVIPMITVEILTIKYAYKQMKILGSDEFTLLSQTRRRHFWRKYHAIAFGAFCYLAFAVLSAIYVDTDEPGILAIIAWIFHWISLGCFFYGYIWQRREI